MSIKRTSGNGTPTVSDISRILVSSKNLTDTIVGERFSSVTGAIQKNNGSIRTELVRVERGKVYTISGFYDSFNFLIIFDSSKRPIARTAAGVRTSFTFRFDLTEFTTAFVDDLSDIAYIAACNYNIPSPQSVKLQVEVGSTPTPYVPHFREIKAVARNGHPFYISQA